MLLKTTVKDKNEFFCC